MPHETVFITGASSGIGLQLAKLFANDGSRLVLLSPDQERLEAVAEELRRTFGVEVLVLIKDLTDPAAPQAIFDQLASQGIDVDVLVNNAGFGALGHVVDLPVDRQMNMIQVNVMAVTHLTRLFLPKMVERNRGGILNLGSTGSYQPGPNAAVYYASKAFVLSFTEALAEELSQTNLHITCMTPGPTKTAFGADSGMETTLVFRYNSMDVVTVARLGHRGFRRGKVIVAPGIVNRFMTFLVRIVPRSVARKVVMAIQR
jgi:uncharacterized protein